MRIYAKKVNRNGDKKGPTPKVATFPTSEKKVEYLKQLFQKTYLTDIKERYKIKNDDDLEELIDIIASSIIRLLCGSSH